MFGGQLLSKINGIHTIYRQSNVSTGLIFIAKTVAPIFLKPSAPMEEGFKQVWMYQHQRRKVSDKLGGFSTKGGRFHTGLEVSAPAEEGFIYLLGYQHRMLKAS